MKTHTETIYKITAHEGSRYIGLHIKGKEIIEYEGNLPYEKSVEDWKFYGKAIQAILRRYEKEKT